MKGIETIKFNLKKIELAKDIFVKEVENGKEVKIPVEMDQSQYPISMRFYDPILIHLQNQMSMDQKE